jgi:hypothetical protein
MQDPHQDLLDMPGTELIHGHFDGRAIAELGMRRREERTRSVRIAPNILGERHNVGDSRSPLALPRRQLASLSAAFV